MNFKPGLQFIKEEAFEALRAIAGVVERGSESPDVYTTLYVYESETSDTLIASFEKNECGCYGVIHDAETLNQLVQH